MQSVTKPKITDMDGTVEMLTESGNESCKLSLSHPHHVFTFGPMYGPPVHFMLYSLVARDPEIITFSYMGSNTNCPPHGHCGMRYVCQFN